MRRVIAVVFLIGLSLAILTTQPARAQSCAPTCIAYMCYLHADVTCQGGQYTYPSNGTQCPIGLPNGCIAGTGQYKWDLEEGQTSCTTKQGACYCPYTGAPQIWGGVSSCS